MIKNDKGFTLIELIIAIAIISLSLGVLLRPFVFSTELNMKAYNLDKANTLAISEAENIKKNCEEYIGNSDSKAEIKYYDSKWNLVGEAAEAKYILESNVSQVNSQRYISTYTQNTYMYDDHEYLIVDEGNEIYLIVYEFNRQGRKYVVKVFTRETGTHTNVTFRNIVQKWKNEYRRLKEIRLNRINEPITDEEKKKMLNKAFNNICSSFIIEDYYPGYWSNNIYPIGDMVNNANFPWNEKIAEAVSEFRGSKYSLPIKLIYGQNMTHYNRANVRIFNFTKEDIELNIHYIMNGEYTYESDLVEVENKELNEVPFLVREGITSIGDVRVTETFSKEKDKNDCYEIEVDIKSKDTGETLVNYTTDNYDH